MIKVLQGVMVEGECAWVQCMCMGHAQLQVHLHMSGWQSWHEVRNLTISHVVVATAVPKKHTSAGLMMGSQQSSRLASIPCEWFRFWSQMPPVWRGINSRTEVGRGRLKQ